MFYITYKDISNRIYGMEVTTRPSIPAPALRGEYSQVAGKDGSLLLTDGTYDNIEIEVSLNFVSPRVKWGDTYRRAKNWLSGSGILRMSDDTDVFYKVKACGIKTADRRAKNGGYLTATFICDPFTYFNSGATELSPTEVSLNPYYLARPIYKIKGNGNCTLTVNGKTMNAVVGQNLTIDTDKMFAYREDGTLQNTAVTGDYDDLVLLPGQNSISITNGFDLKIISNFRSL